MKDGKVAEVTFKDRQSNRRNFQRAGPDGRKFFETIGDTENAKVFEILEKNNIIPNYERAEKTPIWQQVLISWFPMLLALRLLLSVHAADPSGRWQSHVLREEQSAAY